MNISAQRLYQAAKEIKGLTTAAQLGRALHVSAQAVKNWESRGVSKTGLLAAQNILGISAAWVLTGQGEMLADMNTPSVDALLASTQTVSAAPAYYNGIDSGIDNTISIKVPFYKKIKLTPNGSFADDIKDYNQSRYVLLRSTLRQCNVNSNDVICIKMDGDNMYPVIPADTVLAINTAEDGYIRDNKIYAVNQGGLLRIYMLKKRPDNRILLLNYNNDYAKEEVNCEEICVIGHVFWWAVTIS